jgi:hypothetical protein
MNLLHLLWILPLTAFVGFQIGSIVEYRKKYNFADLEKDILALLESKFTLEEQAIVRNAVGLLRNAEFWKKGK